MSRRTLNVLKAQADQRSMREKYHLILCSRRDIDLPELWHRGQKIWLCRLTQVVLRSQGKPMGGGCTWFLQSHLELCDFML
jgi:hypothetical protein